MSESKARLERDIIDLRKQLDERTSQLTRLLDYVIDMQREYVAIDWPDLPDRYGEHIWRLTNV